MDKEIELEQYLASAVRYIQNRAETKQAPYFDDVPKDFAVPSLYFPVPQTRSKKVTFQTYLTTIRVEAWFFAATDWEAYADAANVRDCLLLDDCRIDVMEKDGTLTGKIFRVTEPEIREIDTGIVKLSFEIRHYFSAGKESGEKANKYNFTGLIKPDALYQAWYAATEEQRKDEEVQKECLQKALENL